MAGYDHPDHSRHHRQHLCLNVNTWEIITIDRRGREKTVHVIAADASYALIEFREKYCLDNWRVESLRELSESLVIELPA